MGVIEVIQRRSEGGAECEIRGEAGERLIYRADSALPKPGFHPLVTPAGAVVTGWEPSDHVWHRGLWFTFKYVNGENFWEEIPPYGVQCPADGGPRAELLADGSVRLCHESVWRSDRTGEAVRESRTWQYRPFNRGMAIDFSTRLTALQELKLDRTPYTTWGGYGGLSLRASREMHGVEFVTPQGAVPPVPGLTGQPHPWLVMRGRMDGGRDRWVSMLIADHPSNVRHPTPWYAKSSDGFTFWNAALLFHEPLTVPKGDVLSLRYRVWIVDGRWDDTAAWGRLAGDFAAEA